MNDNRQQLPVQQDGPTFHSSIVLFYKYFLPSQYPLLHLYASYYEKRLESYQRGLCERLGLKGRILLSREGVNGNLSAASPDGLQRYIDEVEKFELVREFGVPDGVEHPSGADSATEYLFVDIDWKRSTVGVGSSIEPFPDLKIAVVKEIISTNDSIPVEDIPKLGGTHLSPSEFHDAILANDNVVLLDVRNTFEYDIGHFVNPNTNHQAINPNTMTFSSFDDTFCAHNADSLRDKKVLMYCTGGIRCEKASVMLKKRGVKDVSQLKGGIHRYLEEYGDHGLFRGLNFVFDQRVAVRPSDCRLGDMENISKESHEIVGKCIECFSPFEQLSGSKLCTVCRTLVLVCPDCTNVLREYHCGRHQSWKSCYFTFLEVFDQSELQVQYNELSVLREKSTSKNVRRTLLRQMDKIQAHIAKLQEGALAVDRNAKKRCRSCSKPIEVCEGQCWGFWKPLS